jgi:hypothetical protein
MISYSSPNTVPYISARSTVRYLILLVSCFLHVLIFVYIFSGLVLLLVLYTIENKIRIQYPFYILVAFDVSLEYRTSSFSLCKFWWVKCTCRILHFNMWKTRNSSFRQERCTILYFYCSYFTISTVHSKVTFRRFFCIPACGQEEIFIPDKFTFYMKKLVSIFWTYWKDLYCTVCIREIYFTFVIQHQQSIGMSSMGTLYTIQ